MKRIAIILFITFCSICLCGSYANAQDFYHKSCPVRDEFVFNGVSYTQTFFMKSDEESSGRQNEKYVFHCPTKKFLIENGIHPVMISYSFTSGENVKGHYIREFVYTGSRQAISVEYGSMELGFIRDGTRKSYYLPLDTLVDYLSYGKASKIKSILVFTKSDGSYAHELFNDKALFGLRYYSALNKREYSLILK